MATLRKRGDHWQVQVRRKGFKPRSKSFAQRKDAERWGTLQERDMDLTESRGEAEGASIDLTLGELLARYRTTVVPTKRARETERYLVAAIERRSIAKLRVRALKAADVTAYRDQRLIEVGPAGVLRELRLMQHAVETARSGWGMTGLSNPFKDVRKPSEPKGRERRLLGGEEARLLAAAAECRNPFIVPIIRFALATGMRQGEMLSLQWSRCDLTARVATLPLTKNGKARTVPLSKEAVKVLSGLPQCNGSVFQLSREALKQSWARLVKRAALDDLHFHDLRHEAISRLFEIGLELPEVMTVSGHTDPRMLVRYTHLHAFRLVEKLDAGLSDSHVHPALEYAT